MPAWETYYKELLSTGNGHALWEADPGSDSAVDIADVGYMEEGAFVRLFNASKEIGDVSNKFGIPNGYKPLRVGALREGTLSASLPITSKTVLQRKVGGNLSGGHIVQSGGSFVFECAKDQGAVLILGEDADRSNALQKQRFIDYVLENHGTWLKFANDVHERGVSLDQLLLVTGCDRTSAWACAAFSASSNNLGLEFQVGNVGVAQGGISVWGSWNNFQSVHVHSGPRVRRTQPPDLSRRATELQAAGLLSPDNGKENGSSTAVDSIPLAIALGDEVPLVNGAKTEQGNTNLPQEGDGCTASPNPLHEVLLSRIMLYSWILGRVLFRLCSYVFRVAFGGSPSRSIQPLQDSLSEIVERTHSPESSKDTDVTQASLNQTSEKQSSASDSPPRNQCVFVRGFKVCDRTTMRKRMRFLGRKKLPPEDGFTHLNRRKKDDKDDPGRSPGSSTNNSCYSSGDRDSPSGRSTSTGEDESTSSGSQSQYGSQCSWASSIMESETDSTSLFDTQSGHEFALHQQCRDLKQPTHLDILMEYILENSPAELALVHHDDLTTLLEHVTSMSAFESVLYQLAPTIFIDNGIGMLEATFRASQDAKSKSNVTHIFPSKSTTQVLACRSSRVFGTHFDSMNSKLLETALSFVKTELTRARIEKLLIPWGEHFASTCSLTPSPSYSASKFDAILQERTMSRFSSISRERWQPASGDAVTIPGATRSYFELSKRHVTEWVDAQGKGTVAAPEPPNSGVETISCHFVASCFNSVQGFTALSFVLSDHSPRFRFPKSGASSNISSDTSVSFFSSSLWSSRYAMGNPLKRLKEKVTNAMGRPSIMTRSRRHISLLRKWERGRGEKLGFEERSMVLAMLQDALEISRDCYSAKYNRVAYRIGRQVQRWLQSFSLISQASETTQWLIQVHVCLLSLLLSRISRLDPIMTNLAHDVLSNLTRIPISLQEHSTPAAVICLVVNELSYSKHRFQHSWLGVWLARIIELNLKVRHLTEQEVKALGVLAMRRKEDKSIVRGVKCCRPWEVAIFTQVAAQETCFKPIVLDIHGLPSLVNALECMLADNIDRYAVHWNRVALTLRAMSFSLEQEWVASIIKPRIISSLLRVFRRSIPEKWFCVRFWAADAIRNLVAHQPSLVQTLLKEDAVAAIETLADPKLDLGPGRPVNRRVNQIKTSVQARLFEDYKREGLKRAAELVLYVGQWAPESLPKSKLEVVAPGWGGYLGGVEETTD